MSNESPVSRQEKPVEIKCSVGSSGCLPYGGNKSAYDALLRSWPIRGGMLPPAPEVPYAGQHWDWGAIQAEPQIDPTAWIAPGATVIGHAKCRELLIEYGIPSLEAARKQNPIPAGYFL